MDGCAEVMDDFAGLPAFQGTCHSTNKKERKNKIL